MANSVATADRFGLSRLSSKLLWNWPRDLLAGSACGVISVLFGVSYAALIFSGPLTPWLAIGVASVFVSTLIASAVTALRSSLPFVIAAPDSTTSAVTAVLIGTLTQNLIAQGGADLAGPALIVIAATTAVTGLLLSGLGSARAGRAIRFVPYPVIGGFLGATGVLILCGAVHVMTDARVAFSDLGALFSGASMGKLFWGVLVAVIIAIARLVVQSRYTMPVVLVCCAILFHLGLALTGASPAQAVQAGLTFAPVSAAPFPVPWRGDALAHFPWGLLPSMFGGAVAVAIVTCMGALLNTAAIELTTRRDADLDSELTALGLSNVLSALFGGVVSCISLSRTTLGFEAGARGRLAGLVAAAIAGLMLFAGPGFVSLIPKSVVGGLLLFMGFDLAREWLAQSARRLSAHEYASLVLVAGVILFWGFIPGIIFGVIIGCATFALNASRVDCVNFRFDLSQYRSSLDRSAHDIAILTSQPQALQGLSLRSYLFFGSAARLYQDVKSILADAPGCRFLVFDFRLVTGLDSSASQSFARIKQAAQDHGARLVLVGLPHRLHTVFAQNGFITSEVLIEKDLDHALEVCENRLLAQEGGLSSGKRALAEWLADVLHNAEFAETLAQKCRRATYNQGDIIARQGTPSDSMHFILEGRVSVVVALSGGRSVRVRSLGAETTIGEMGLITRRPRSAHLFAEDWSVIYELSLQNFEQLKEERPELIQALMTYVIEIMGERLNFASRTIGVLQQ